MTVTPREKNNFSAKLQRAKLRQLGLVFVSSTPASAICTNNNVGQWGANERDALVMTVAERNGTTLSQGDSSVLLAKGDIAFRDLSKPWRSDSDGLMKLTLLKIPFSTAAKFHSDPECLVGRHLSASLPWVAFASSTIRASRIAMQADPTDDWIDTLDEVLEGVIRLICSRENRDPGYNQRKNHSNHRREAMNYILGNLDNPMLTVASVANALGISTRQLQRAFLDTGISPRQFILNQRLDIAAKKLLQKNTGSYERITDIAMATGFNDTSHFSRAFAQRFSCSPREYRKRND